MLKTPVLLKIVVKRSPSIGNMKLCNFQKILAKNDFEYF